MTAFILGAAIGGAAAYFGRAQIDAVIARAKELIAKAKAAADDY